MDNPNCIEQAGPWSLSARLMTLACLIVFMAQMATTVYLPSLPVVMSDLAMTRQHAELSISLFVIGAALPLLFWGAAADRYGRRRPLTLSLLLFVGISLLLATTSQGPLLLVLRTLQGIAAGGATIIARILIRDHWQGMSWLAASRFSPSPSSRPSVAANGKAGSSVAMPTGSWGSSWWQALAWWHWR